MKEIYDRTQRLIGAEAMENLKDARVLVVGLGGVGGYIAEALVRAGVGTLGLCDFDTVDPSNLNRQIFATTDVIGKNKVEIAKERLLKINPECNIKLFPFKINPQNLNELDLITACPDGYKKCVDCGKCLKCWDFVADAIDDVPAKLALIETVYKNNIPIISSMGTGNKLNPFEFEIAPVEKTEGDPLARAIRKKLREKEIKDIPVLYSKETAKNKIESGDPVPSISYMPAVAGLEMASYIIRKIIK